MASVKDFIVTVGLDASDATKTLNTLESRISKLATAVNKVASISSKVDAQTARTAKIESGTELNRVRSAKIVNSELDKKAAKEERINKANYSWQDKLETQRSKHLGASTRLDQLSNTAWGKSTKKGGGAQEVAGLKKNLISLDSRLKATTNHEELIALKQEYNELRESIKKAGYAQTEFNRTFNLGRFVVNSAKDSIMQLGRSYLSVFAVIAGGKVAVDAIGNIESIRASFLASSDGAADANQKFQWVVDTSQEMGLPLQEAARGFSQISVAAKASGMTAKQAQEIFLGASEAAVAYGLSAEDTSGAIRAFTQVLGKQRVTAEELRQQLGDRMPNAITTMAKAAGVGVEDLDKLLQAGKVGTDVFYKFTQLLREEAHATGAYDAGIKSVTRSFTRLRNTIELTLSALGDSGLSTVISFVVNRLRDLIEYSVLAVKFINKMTYVVLAAAAAWAVFTFGLGTTLIALGAVTASVVLLTGYVAIMAAPFLLLGGAIKLLLDTAKYTGLLNSEVEEGASFVEKLTYNFKMFGLNAQLMIFYVGDALSKLIVKIENAVGWLSKLSNITNFFKDNFTVDANVYANSQQIKATGGGNGSKVENTVKVYLDGHEIANKMSDNTSSEYVNSLLSPTG